MKAGEKIVFKGVEVITVHDENLECDGCIFHNNSEKGCPNYMIEDITGDITELDCFEDKIVFKKPDHFLGQRTKFIATTYVSVYDNSGTCQRCDISEFNDPLICDQIDVDIGIDCNALPVVFIKLK